MKSFSSKSPRFRANNYSATKGTKYHPFIGNLQVFEDSGRHKILGSKVNLSQFGLKDMGLLKINERLSHDNLLRIEGIHLINNERDHCLFLEFFNNTLQEEIYNRKMKKTPFSEDEIIYILGDISGVLAYLQGNKIFHMQIRTDSILKVGPRYKLIDVAPLPKYKEAQIKTPERPSRKSLTPNPKQPSSNKSSISTTENYKNHVLMLGNVILDCMTLDADGSLLEAQKLDMAKEHYSLAMVTFVKRMLEINVPSRLDCATCYLYVQDLAKSTRERSFAIRDVSGYKSENSYMNASIEENRPFSSAQQPRGNSNTRYHLDERPQNRKENNHDNKILDHSEDKSFDNLHEKSSILQEKSFNQSEEKSLDNPKVKSLNKIEDKDKEKDKDKFLNQDSYYSENKVQQQLQEDRIKKQEQQHQVEKIVVPQPKDILKDSDEYLKKDNRGGDTLVYVTETQESEDKKTPVKEENKTISILAPLQDSNKNPNENVADLSQKKGQPSQTESMAPKQQGIDVYKKPTTVKNPFNEISELMNAGSPTDTVVTKDYSTDITNYSPQRPGTQYTNINDLATARLQRKCAAKIQNGEITKSTQTEPISETPTDDFSEETTHRTPVIKRMRRIPNPDYMRLPTFGDDEHLADHEFNLERSLPIPKNNRQFVTPKSQRKSSIHEAPLDISIKSGERSAQKPPPTVTEVFPDGSVYRGEVHGKMRHGVGRMTYPDGSCYEGEWNQDVMEGYGVFFYSNGKIAYEGEWQNNKCNGRGVMYNEQNYSPLSSYESLYSREGPMWQRYEGGFCNDRWEGEGRLFFSNGDEFCGDFVNDLFHGFGKYINRTGEEQEGEWCNNKLIRINK